MNPIIFSAAFGAQFPADVTCTALSDYLVSTTGLGVTCGAEQLVVGTTLQQGVGDSGTSGTVDYIGVAYVSGGSGSPSYATWQEAAAAQGAAIAGLDTKFSALQTVIGSNGVDPETIAASSTIFAGFLLAAVTVWAAKRLYALFHTSEGGD